jgi:hypothetical protein
MLKYYILITIILLLLISLVQCDNDTSKIYTLNLYSSFASSQKISTYNLTLINSNYYKPKLNYNIAVIFYFSQLVISPYAFENSIVFFDDNNPFYISTYNSSYSSTYALLVNDIILSDNQFLETLTGTPVFKLSNDSYNQLYPLIFSYYYASITPPELSISSIEIVFITISIVLSILISIFIIFLYLYFTKYKQYTGISEHLLFIKLPYVNLGFSLFLIIYYNIYEPTAYIYDNFLLTIFEHIYTLFSCVLRSSIIITSCYFLSGWMIFTFKEVILKIEKFIYICFMVDFIYELIMYTIADNDNDIDNNYKEKAYKRIYWKNVLVYAWLFGFNLYYFVMLYLKLYLKVNKAVLFIQHEIIRVLKYKLDLYKKITLSCFCYCFVKWGIPLAFKNVDKGIFYMSLEILADSVLVGIVLFVFVPRKWPVCYFVEVNLDLIGMQDFVCDISKGVKQIQNAKKEMVEMAKLNRPVIIVGPYGKMKREECVVSINDEKVSEVNDNGVFDEIKIGAFTDE